MVPMAAGHASQERDVGVVAEARVEDALTALVGLVSDDMAACNRTIIAPPLKKVIRKMKKKTGQP